MVQLPTFMQVYNFDNAAYILDRTCLTLNPIRLMFSITNSRIPVAHPCMGSCQYYHVSTKGSVKNDNASDCQMIDMDCFRCFCCKTNRKNTTLWSIKPELRGIHVKPPPLLSCYRCTSSHACKAILGFNWILKLLSQFVRDCLGKDAQCTLER